MITIPILEDTPFIDQVTNLDGVDYLLQIRYNQRQQRFSISIGSPDGTLYRAGKAIVCNNPLFPQAEDLRFPPGLLIAMSSDIDTSPPKIGELGPGKRVELYYMPAAELAG